MTEWRWTDERGVQRLVGTEELRAALSSQVLPPTTLVWREGMKEWAPASTVPELSGAVGGKAPADVRKGLPADPAGAAAAGAERPERAPQAAAQADHERHRWALGEAIGGR